MSIVREQNHCKIKVYLSNRLTTGKTRPSETHTGDCIHRDCSTIKRIISGKNVNCHEIVRNCSSVASTKSVFLSWRVFGSIIWCLWWEHTWIHVYVPTINIKRWLQSQCDLSQKCSHVLQSLLMDFALFTLPTACRLNDNDSHDHNPTQTSPNPSVLNSVPNCKVLIRSDLINSDGDQNSGAIRT